MNILTIFIIIILIILICLYFYQNMLLEKFDSSIYFQNNVDYDLIQNTYKNPTITNKLWDGLWQNTSLNIYARFIQNNDKLLIALSNTTTSLTTSPPTNPPTTCTNNLFECIGQLNNSYDMFYSKTIVCNNYTISGQDMSNLSGYILNNTITLNNSIILTKIQSLSNTSPYMKVVSPNVNLYSILPDSTQDYMNIAPSILQSSYNGTNLDLCNYLKFFNKNNCNSCVICYISNIGNVQTLNYQFFGPLSNESSLTVQYDMMNNILNMTPNGLLTYYRNISSTSTQIQINNKLSFTNCIENIKPPSSIQICQTMINTYIPSISNNNLYPVVWEINASTSTLNSCSFILSTSKLYNTPQKYAEFNNDGTTNLSLFNGGIKQELILENVNIIKDGGANNYVIITTNIKTNNNLYLIPGNNYGLSNNSNLLNTTKHPEQNSKWLILGFNLSNITMLNTILNSSNFQ